MPADQPQWIKDHCRAVGERVRAARLWADLSQEELAERAEISWITVHRIEAGAVNTKLMYLVRIAGALEVDVADFFTDG